MRDQKYGKYLDSYVDHNWKLGSFFNTAFSPVSYFILTKKRMTTVQSGQARACIASACSFLFVHKMRSPLYLSGLMPPYYAYMGALEVTVNKRQNMCATRHESMLYLSGTHSLVVSLGSSSLNISFCP